MNTFDMKGKDIQAVAKFCKDKLDLTNPKLYGEYDSQSLPLCVIDAIFSINANYTSTENTVSRFCKYFGLRQRSPVQPPNIADQLSVEEFIKLYDQFGVEGMAKRVYQNRQRTSTTSGILKSEAVLMFSKELLRFGVNYFQDASRVIDNPDFESAIKQIPGQASGLSLRYFYMWVGSENHVKPDRMLTRFVQSAIGRPPSEQEAHDIVVGACGILAKEYPRMTPRVLDNLIWQYQRTQK